MIPRTAWLLFVLLVLAAIAVPKLAQSQANPLCNNDICVVPRDEYLAIIRRIEHLKTMISEGGCV